TFTCACNEGWSGDGVNCADMDECAAGTDNCDNNADCANTTGSFTCTCKEGWEGDGVNCTDINECALSTDNCDTNAECTNTPGTFTCACNEGWSGDGVTCTDVDECAAGTDNCDNNADCANTTGSFTCTCKEGWEGDGVTCADFDECASGTDTCDPNADCINTTGDYFCSCQSGYTGDGYTCADVNECASGIEECDPDATCTNIEGSYECACITGYSGDGFDCYDIDECAEGTDTCDPNANCQNTAGSYSCSCQSGYTGNGYTCEDIPCYNQVGVGGCATNATCDGTLVTDNCLCETGYVGDPVSEPGCDICDSVGGYVNDGSGGCLLASAPEEGDLVVNELFLEPLAVPAVDGQWFEIYNTTDATLNLANLEIEVDGVVHTLASTAWFLSPAAYIVAGPNDDPGTNGGVDLDITFVSMPQLSTDGTITLSLPGSPAVVIDELVWSSDWNHNSSHSLALSPGALGGDMALLNNDALHWCHTKTSNFGNGDFGTPGSENDSCTVDYCHLQYPATTEVNQNTSTELIYGRVYEESSTPGIGQGAFISAQVGFGNENSVPDDSWTWFSTYYNGDYDGLTVGDLANDEFAGSMDATILGPFDYAYRFSLDGGLSWTYCDLDGSDNGYQFDQAGVMTVLPEAPKLFISQYVEGSSYNKAIEVYNNTGGNYDLANCSILVYFNGSTGSTSSITLSGILVSGDVHVLCDDSADQSLLDLCDQTHNQNWFNGDDAVVLNCGGSDVDVIGQVGFDPGTEWGSSYESTEDNTLIRDCSITTGDSIGTDTFDPTNGDWTGNAQDTFTDLGSHTTCY
nr:hypothetical protein [Deltaproteobacteria bacterium]